MPEEQYVEVFIFNPSVFYLVGILCDLYSLIMEYSYQSSSSIMAPFFANGTCDPFHSVEQKCSLGNYVVNAVNVSKPEHVSKALAFATKYNIRVVIRNTGHECVLFFFFFFCCPLPTCH